MASRGDPETVALQLALDGTERIVGELHEQPAQHLHDNEAAPRRGAELGDPAAGRAGLQVERADEARLAGNIADQLLLVPDVVARGQHVDPGVEERLADLDRDAETGGGVLAVDDERIELQPLAQFGRALDQDGTARSPDDIADVEQAHAVSPAGAERWSASR